MAEVNGEDVKESQAQQHQVYQACKMLDLEHRFAIPHSVAKSLLPLYLTGGAKLKYQQIPDRDTLSWKELVTELATRLKSQALLSDLRDELHNMTQGRDSVGEFAKKIYGKTKTAFQGQGDRIVSRMAIDFFIKGLNPEIRKAIRRLPDTDDFEVIVSNAEKEFRILEQERREDRDTIQAINALISDEKINQLERQLNGMKVTPQRRPPTSNLPRSGNRFRQNNWKPRTPMNFNTVQRTFDPPRRTTFFGRPPSFWPQGRRRRTTEEEVASCPNTDLHTTTR
ncbi:hypothetical protein Aduo_018885 [Ancylostoma duodenale]